MGSSASLKSRLKLLRDWRELKKRECGDLSAKSSSKMRMRRLVGESGEEDVVKKGRIVRRRRRFMAILEWMWGLDF